ncbi:MAG: DotU family type IV/VI secretion system protein [Desulfobacteraceae bacterium]|nr:DotU family type IV/VI secretion system protein [Desulfobacteraceae bacterium]
MRLSDCFIEIIAYTEYIVGDTGGEKPPYEQVRNNIQRLICQSDASREKGNFSQQDYDLARFAVFAWTDEAILASNWQGRQHWQREQLQRIYYQTAESGELFFERLNSIGPHQRDVREVYYICLCLGFTGQYCNAGDDFLLEQLRISNLKLLTGSSVGLPALKDQELFPEAYPMQSAQAPHMPQQRRWSTFTLACGASPILLYGVLYIIYRFILHNIGNNLIGTVP